ncbi:hypothetical protein HPB51_006473 [Rhipicephalus microplus]|uniref:Uncharacterized protein n=1 Tax=Rhipicephalus microplus TaxID=6941 RepID=A0A9J6E7D5_RHIMP|nr:hypothetical protein HPB51_006473 [Rhipicephalus microplus]
MVASVEYGRQKSKKKVSRDAKAGSDGCSSPISARQRQPRGYHDGGDAAVKSPCDALPTPSLAFVDVDNCVHDAVERDSHMRLQEVMPSNFEAITSLFWVSLCMQAHSTYGQRFSQDDVSERTTSKERRITVAHRTPLVLEKKSLFPVDCVKSLCRDSETSRLEGDTQRHRHVPRSDLSSGCRGGLQAKCGNVADVVSWTFRKPVASPLKWDVILYGKTTPCMVSQCQGLETSTRHDWCYNIIATSHHATSVVCVVTVFKL